MPNALTEDTFVVLRNPHGEATGSEPIPATVADWEEATGIGAHTHWFRSLVRRRSDGGYGLLVEREFAHGDAEVPDPSDGPRPSEAEMFERLTRVADAVQRATTCAVFLGRRTGAFGRHQLAVLIPADASPEEAQAALTAVDSALASAEEAATAA